MSLPTITDLQLLQEYREARQRQFQSESSVDWFCRKHRDRLVSAGALLKISGRTWVHPARFDQVVIEEGSAAMSRPE